VKKTLTASPENLGSDFVELRPGVALASGDLDCVTRDLDGASLYVLEAGAPDVRDVMLEHDDAAYFLGDHLGFEPSDRERLSALGATPVSVGPLNLHSDDVVAILSNELDRLQAPNR
jgi:tRNA pseudouridine-54 N-methylase